MSSRKSASETSAAKEVDLEDSIQLSMYAMNPFLLDYFKGDLKFDQLCVVLNRALAKWPDNTRYHALGVLVSKALDANPKLPKKIRIREPQSLPKQLEITLARVAKLLNEREGLPLSNPNDYTGTAYHKAAELFAGIGISARQVYERYRSLKDLQ